ncbi:hypothetical protein TI39_contig380g00015 [Zymoseptoria brevis]|uniref:Uncharacterized protein n=1 Tax=Zymoseptoria brevis TaxID=1047168 RepID=A0A0F4GNJ7_9PEZI|nr:hypothetical protein TI39_contig380g00015 [Zymoseptoria brevis]
MASLGNTRKPEGISKSKFKWDSNAKGKAKGKSRAPPTGTPPVTHAIRIDEPETQDQGPQCLWNIIEPIDIVVSKVAIAALLRSGGVLPILDRFLKDVRHQKLEHAMSSLVLQWSPDLCRTIADDAMRLDRGRFKHQNGARVLCARYAWIPANKNQDTFINDFNSDESKPETILSVCAAVLMRFMEDVKSEPVHGFFAILLQSKLVMPMHVELRERWAAHFTLPLPFFCHNQEDEDAKLGKIKETGRNAKIVFELGNLTAQEEIIFRRASDTMVSDRPMTLNNLSSIFVYRNAHELVRYHKARISDFKNVDVKRSEVLGSDSSKERPRTMMPKRTEESIPDDETSKAKRMIAALQASVLDNNSAAPTPSPLPVSTFRNTIEPGTSHATVQAAEDREAGHQEAVDQEGAGNQSLPRAEEIEIEMLLKLDEVSMTRIQELEWSNKQAATKSSQ